MIDFHCHLDLYPKPIRVIDECQKRGLYVLSVTTTPSAWRGTKALAKTGKRIQTALGFHPQLAHERKDELELFDELISKTGYVGEIGLDGAPEFKRYWHEQISVFQYILNSCQRAGGKIMSIHSRRASSAVLDCLKADTDAGIPILHWFSGPFKDLDRAIQQDCWFSVGPAMLLSNKGRDLVIRMPRNRILPESDGPFTRLHKRSILPWDVIKVVSELSILWGSTEREVQEAFNDNLRRLLKLI